MATGWQTFPVEMMGGLVTNLGPLQLGTQRPGAARFMRNFEPSVDGGYRRILGFQQYNPNTVPPYGTPLVQGSGQTGTTLIIADIHTSPKVGDTFTVAGVDGTYEITDVVSWTAVSKVATVDIDVALDSSPADKAAVTFTNNNDVINGIFFYRNKAVVSRNDTLFEADTTSAWSKINTPDYGTVTVNGAGQTGTTLTVAGMSLQPRAGDTFTVAGVELVYTVVSSTATTVTFTPALATSPADAASVTFLTASRTGSDIVRYARYNFTGVPKVIVVDGVNVPATYDGTTFTPLNAAPSDVVGAQHVVEYKSSIFFAKGTQLVFTAPFTDSDFSAANGSGVINVAHTITGLIVFREQLIVFANSKIFRLAGSTIADFQFQPITQDIGCVAEDTIQEIGGDIMFMGPDGLRLLSATERNNDFGLATASRPIHKETTEFTNNGDRFCSLLVREKAQYRVFGYRAAVSKQSSRALLATQFVDQSADQMAWSELRGFKAYVADSFYTRVAGEVCLFANDDGFVYQMERGNRLDNVPIRASYHTPFYVMDQPTVRKTLYKVKLYTDASGTVIGTLNLRFDYDEPDVIQPNTLRFSNVTDTVSIYGTATYGIGTYGGRLVTQFTKQVVGSGFAVSLEYSFNEETPPFTLDAVTLEFAYQDRQ